MGKLKFGLLIQFMPEDAYRKRIDYEHFTLDELLAGALEYVEAAYKLPARFREAVMAEQAMKWHREMQRLYTVRIAGVTQFMTMLNMEPLDEPKPALKAGEVAEIDVWAEPQPAVPEAAETPKYSAADTDAHQWAVRHMGFTPNGRDIIVKFNGKGDVFKL